MVDATVRAWTLSVTENNEWVSVIRNPILVETLMDDSEELTHESRCAAAFICLHKVDTGGIVFTLIVVTVIHVGFTSVPCEACRAVTARGKRQDVVSLLNLTCMPILIKRIFLQYFYITFLNYFWISCTSVCAVVFNCDKRESDKNFRNN